MGKPETKVAALGKDPGATRQTLYRQVGPDGTFREDGRKLLLPFPGAKKLEINYLTIII